MRTKTTITGFVIAVVVVIVLWPISNLFLASADDIGPWLILNGEYIEPPFDVEAFDGNIFINGRPVLYPQATPDVIVSDSTISECDFEEGLHSAMVNLAPTMDLESLKQAALDYCRQSDLVQLATATDDGVRVHWVSGRMSTSYGLAGLYIDTPPLPSVSDLTPEAEAYQEALAFPGQLLVIVDGSDLTIGLPASRQYIHRFREIAADESLNVEQLADSIEEMVPFRSLATELARKFNRPSFE